MKLTSMLCVGACGMRPMSLGSRYAAYAVSGLLLRMLMKKTTFAVLATMWALTSRAADLGYDAKADPFAQYGAPHF